MTNYRLIDKTQNQSAATARVTLISMSNGLQSIKVQNHANPMFFDSITNRKTTVEKAHITRKLFAWWNFGGVAFSTVEGSVYIHTARPVLALPREMRGQTITNK